MQDNDLFLVNRPDEVKTYKQEKVDLMAQLQDTDLLLVNRADTTYKITGQEFKNSITPDAITPSLGQVTIQPQPLSGTGSLQDPFVLRTVDAAPKGASVSTQETITFYNQSPNAPVEWIVSDALRFLQPTGIVGTDGKWIGQLQYTDEPASVANSQYPVLAHVGDCYFSWQVNQYVTGFAGPSIENVTVTKIRQSSSGSTRYTDCDFEIKANMFDDGVPTSTKTFVPKFEGVTSFYQYTEPTVSYNSSNKRLYFNNPAPAGWDNFKVNDQIQSTTSQIDYGPIISAVERIINVGYAWNARSGPSNNSDEDYVSFVTVPANANFVSVICTAAGGGSQGWDPPWADSVPAASPGTCSPSGGGGGGGTAYIISAPCTPGEIINTRMGVPGGPSVPGQTRPGNSWAQGRDSTVTGTGWSLRCTAGRMNNYAGNTSQQTGASGGTGSVSGSSGSGAVYTGTGTGTGGQGGTGYRLVYGGQSSTANPNKYYSQNGGGGGAGGFGCQGGRGGNGTTTPYTISSGTPANGGYGGGMKMNSRTQNNNGGNLDGEANNCYGGAGGGGAKGTNNGGDNGLPNSGYGRGCGGSGYFYISGGGSAGCTFYFSADGDRDPTTNTNVNESVVQSYEYDLVMGAGFAPIAYTLKVGDSLYSSGGVSGVIKSISGNNVTVSSPTPRNLTTDVNYYTSHTATGTISDIKNIPGDTYWELTSSNDRWIPDQEVRSPNRVNSDGSTVVYGTMANDGVTCNGISLTPTTYPFTPDNKSTSMTVLFPSTWDSGNTPDSELPNGTAFLVTYAATNDQGTAQQESEPFNRSMNVLTYDENDHVELMSAEDNTQLLLNAATYNVRTVAARKQAVDSALIASGITQQQLNDTYGV